MGKGAHGESNLTPQSREMRARERAPLIVNVRRLSQLTQNKEDSIMLTTELTGAAVVSPHPVE